MSKVNRGAPRLIFLLCLEALILLQKEMFVDCNNNSNNNNNNNNNNKKKKKNLTLIINQMILCLTFLLSCYYVFNCPWENKNERDYLRNKAYVGD